jgi:hypothetical protein
MAACNASPLVLRRPLQRIFSNHSFMPIAVRPDSILQTTPVIRQMARYAKLAARRERPRFASDMDAEIELMSRSRYSFQHAKAVARIDIIRHLSPRASVG